ncbi:MAG TPA: NAD(P)H-dependent oxidoreductase, partial [Gemmatimonadales bacterium]
MRLLAFAASLRAESHNRRLIGLVAELARGRGAEVDLAEFREFDMPLFDADLHAREGIPPGAQELGARILAADGILLASP